MKPLVSIVIPVYNGEDYVQEAIESALNQTYENIEVLVVNDGSTDRTEQIARAYGERIRYFYKPNGGVASALNLGIREMRGKYFSWLSHDDYDYPEKIETLMEAILQQKDRNVIAYCNFSFLDQKTGILSPYHMEEYYSEKDRVNGTFMIMQNQMEGGSMLIPLSYFRRVGLFDEKRLSTQDYDMWFRMLRGKEMIHVPKVLHMVRVHEKQGSQTMTFFYHEKEQLFLQFVQKLSVEEMSEIWGSEYCCLQNLFFFFENRGMKMGCEYVRQRLKQCEPPKDSILLLRQANKEIYRMGEKKAEQLAIFGAGDYGRRVLRFLHLRGIAVNAFWDNDPQKWGIKIEGIKCVSVEEGLQDNGAKTLVILAAELFGAMQKQLEGKKIAGMITNMHLEGKFYMVPFIRGEEVE